MGRENKVELNLEYSVSQLGKKTFAKNVGPVPAWKRGYLHCKSW